MNNRIYKFKAWNKKEKKFIKLNEVINYMGLMINELMTHKHIELIQFTGLLDCYGKEIYEGDILDCQWNIDNKMKGKDKVLYEVKDLRDFYYDEKEGQVDLENSWIIGNIYENPKLLKIIRGGDK